MENHRQPRAASTQPENPVKLFRRGQPGRIPTRPVPPDTTHPFTRPAITLLQDRPALTAAQAPPQLSAPAPMRAIAPPPPGPPARPRPAWAPPRPPAPVRITEPALLACPGGRVPAALTLPCRCHRVHTRGATSSFPDLYATAEQDGWRRDLFGIWACPACQAQSGWRAPSTPVLCGEYPEAALIRDVAAQAAPRWRWRKALRTARVLLDARALRALR